MKGFKLGFNRWLQKSEAGKTYLNELSEKKKLGELRAKEQEEHNSGIQSKQKELLKNLIKSERICYIDSILYNKPVWKCPGILDGKTCGQELDIISTLYFGKYPPAVGTSLGLDSKAILDFLYGHAIIKKITCECGYKINLSNKC